MTQIFHKTKIIPFLLEQTTINNLPINHHKKSITTFNHLYFPHIHHTNYITPNLDEIPPHTNPNNYMINSQPKLYNSILILNYKNLYPSIIHTFLINPIELIKNITQPNPKHNTENFLDT